MSNPLQELANFGQSPWLDMISRRMLESGELARLIAEDGAKGVTSNPTLFDKAVSGSADYDPILRRALAEGVSEPHALFERIAIGDIRDAADALRPVYESSQGVDGYVSLEVSPTLAYDKDGTLAEAKRLWEAVGRKNLMIKIPATRPCLPAVEAALAQGLNVNVTLIFSLERYAAVMNSYLAALERRAKEGLPLAPIASVASFFVSRIDTAVDSLLPEGSPLKGRAAVANAKTAYHLFRKIFASPRFEALRQQGARVQRPLWASTGTKDPKYSDVLYVDGLIGPDTVNTIPPATWEAFRGHGQPAETLTAGVDEAKKLLESLKANGVDMGAVTAGLEDAGVKAFADSFESLLRNLAKKAEALRAAAHAPDAIPEAAQDRAAPADIVRRLWACDAGLWKTEEAHQRIIRNSLGWLRMPEAMPGRAAEIMAFVEEVRGAGFEHAVVLGMGGSSLAPEVLRRTFGRRHGYPTLHVLDSTDPDTVAAIEAAADPAKTLYIVASKSGTTTEPVAFQNYFLGKVRALKGDRAGEHFVAITDPGTFLEGFAREQRFRKTFINYADIGGRYSALSCFGMVPAALMGIDLQTFLARAGRMAEACKSVDETANPGLRLGLELAEQAAAGRDKITFLMSPEIESFGLWLEQLIAESIGKEGKGVVPITGEPIRLPEEYAADKVFVCIQTEGAADTRCSEVVRGLEAAGKPVFRIALVDALDLGAEFFRWEVATAVIGAMLGIDPFDQPDVQKAKDKTKTLLAELKQTGRLPSPEKHWEAEGLSLSFSQAAAGAAAGGTSSVEEPLARFLALAKKNDYIGLQVYLPSDGRHDEVLFEMRRALIRTRACSVQWGYGPRYLHSTGQLHKGGEDNGLFLVLCADGGTDLPIPDMACSFRQLVTAQAIGDFQALEAAGRRAVFIRVPADPAAALRRIADAVGQTVQVS